MSTDPEAVAAPPAAHPRRVLRRSATDRVAAGVAGGLGQYAGVDPVLFRVLFAVSAFFGGAGVLAYAIAWAVIPVEGTGRATVDGWIEALRRRRLPPWLLAIAGGVLLWGIAFSWWSPHPPWPLLAVFAVLLVILGTRDGGWRRPAAPADPTTTVSPMASSGLPATAEAPSVQLEKGLPGAPPPWATEARAWWTEARDAARSRRRRAWPLRVAAFGALAAAVIALAVVDALVGIWLPVYFWVAGGIALAALLVGVVLRRAPWSLVPVLVVAALGTGAFGGSHASLHDGIGQQIWTPATSADVRGDYRFALGQGVLDLRRVTPTGPHDIHVTLGAGQVRLILPPAMNATVQTHIRLGDVTVEGDDLVVAGDTGRDDYGVDKTILPPTGATGPAVTIDVDVADGNITVAHR